MKNYSVKKLVFNGLMIALVFLTTYFTRIPTPLPGGYFNLGDAMIMLAAVFLGPIGGMIAGAIGSSLADLAAGAMLFVPVTFVVKGLEGLVVGLLTIKYHQSVKMQQPAENQQEADKGKAQTAAKYKLVVAVILGGIIMVAGYFFAEAFVLNFFAPGFGLTAAIAELLPNFIQGGLSAVLGYILISLLSKMDIGKYIR